jgi:hypothetical protein
MPRPTESKLPKHHYIPSFYSKHWAGADGRFLEYRRGYQNKIFRRWTHPDGTGYVRGLNTIDGLPPAIANAIEDKFLQRADDLASQCLDQYLIGNLEVSHDLKSGWARFMISLLHRPPERIKYLKEELNRRYKDLLDELGVKYQEHRKPTDPITFEEYERQRNPSGRAYAAFFQDIVDSEKVGTALIRMHRGLVKLNTARFPLLTSDRPMVMTNGINKPDSHIVMPISPNMVFIVANEMQTIRQISAMAEKGEMQQILNDRIVRQARK